MSSELSREIRKLDVRLEDYTKADQEFVEHVKGYAKTLRKLSEGLEKRREPPSPDEIKQLSRLRSHTIESLGQVMKSESNVAHERSHLSESYATLILCLEKEFGKLKPNSI